MYISRNKLPVILSLVALGLAGVAILTARHWPREAGLFPLAIAVPVCLLAIVEVVRELKFSKGKTEVTEREYDPILKDDLDDLPLEFVFRRSVILFSWIGGLVLASWLIGVSVALPLFCCFYALVQNYRKWLTALIFGLSIWVFLFILFQIVLPTTWPEPLIMHLLSR